MDREALIARINSSCSLLMDQARQIMLAAENGQMDDSHFEAAFACLDQAIKAWDELARLREKEAA